VKYGGRRGFGAPAAREATGGGGGGEQNPPPHPTTTLSTVTLACNNVAIKPKIRSGK